MKRNRVHGATIGVNTKCRLLSHDARGQEQRGLLAQELGDLFFEFAHDSAVSVQIKLGVRGNLLEETRHGARAISREETRTLCGKVIEPDAPPHVVTLIRRRIRRR